MIVFLDDEKGFVESYVDELEFQGHHIRHVTKVDDAMDLLKKSIEDIELLILDIMMPPGQTFRDVNTIAGLETGIHVYKSIRSLSPDLPIIVFTNMHDHAAVFEEDQATRFLKKQDYFPHELADEVDSFMKSHQRPPSGQGESAQ